MQLITVIELVPGYKTKLDLATVLDESKPEHAAFFEAIKAEVASLPDVQAQTEGKEYYVRLKPVEVEVLIK